MSVNGTDSPSTRARKRPAALACYECRRKHLKCDGVMPVCTRCSSSGATCTYLPSRRGLSSRPEQHQGNSFWADHPHADPPQSDPSTTPSASREPHACEHDNPHAQDRPLGSFEPSGAAQTRLASPFSATERSYLIGQYYSHFHRSHPMMVPRAYFHAQNYPDFLVVACCVVGHHFASIRPSEAHISVAVSMAASAAGADGIFRIQALLLLALVSFGSHEMGRASDCLGRAANIAREVKLESLDVCMSSDSSKNMERESARRTWWELYTVDALFALLEARPPNLTTQSPDALPLAPCAETLYESGNLVESQQTYAEFERRVFLQDDIAFSSHFYRIEAVNLVRRVCPLFTKNDADPQELEAVSNSIASWLYNLPDSSFTSSVIPEDSNHILLQAHLLVQVASIFLHFPRSNLQSSGGPSAIDVTCLRKALPGMENSSQHATKSIAASRELCNIASMPSVQDSHSPLVICGFLLGCAVQLSAASGFDRQCLDQRQQFRHRVVLMLGALRYTGKAWSGAQGALHHLQPFADAVFTTQSDHDHRNGNTSSGNGDLDMSGSSEATMQDGVASGYSVDPAMNSTLDQSLLNINWFDFFQPMDTSGQVPIYDMT